MTCLAKQEQHGSTCISQTIRDDGENWVRLEGRSVKIQRVLAAVQEQPPSGFTSLAIILMDSHVHHLRIQHWARQHNENPTSSGNSVCSRQLQSILFSSSMTNWGNLGENAGNTHWRSRQCILTVVTIGLKHVALQFCYATVPCCAVAATEEMLLPFAFHPFSLRDCQRAPLIP